MINRRLRGSLLGIPAVASYIILTFIAYLHYDTAYSPLTNALSQLGDPLLNPSGGIFYNAGGIMLGMLLIPFYLSMSGWNTGERSQTILTTGAQIAGILSSFGLISSCIFPAGTHTPIHVASVSIAWITSLFFWIFSGFSMLKNPARIRWLPYFGYLPLTAIIILTFVLKETYMVEWVSVFLLLVYIVLLSFSSGRMSSGAKPLIEEGVIQLRNKQD